MTTLPRPAASAPRDYRFPRFERRKLSNGVGFIIAPVKKLPVVTVLAIIDAGGTSDPDGKEGLASLTADALREGTSRRDGLELALELESLGTSVEAGADWDSTIVGMTVLSEHFGEAFALFGEVLTSPAFLTKDIDRLRSERLAERMQILSEPRGLADESFAKFIYAGGSRYSEPLAGGTESVSSIGREDISEFYQRHYGPGATTIVLAGDVDADEAEELLESTLGFWKGRHHPARKTVDERSRTNRAIALVAKADAAQAELRIGHVGVERKHPDYFSIVVMNAVLGGLFSSRINLNLREAHGYTYGASSHFDWRRHAGPFVISTAVQSEVTADAIRETLTEIDRMRSEEIPVDELTLATDYLDGVFPIRYETTAAIASALANMVIFELPDDYYDTYREKVRAVSSADVLAAACKHVDAEGLQVVVVGDVAIIRETIESLGFGPVVPILAPIVAPLVTSGGTEE